jgi:hypothetical protein
MKPSAFVPQVAKNNVLMNRYSIPMHSLQANRLEFKIHLNRKGAKNARDILALAHEKVQEILSKHFPPEQIVGDDKLEKLEEVAGFDAKKRFHHKVTKTQRRT